MQLSRHNNYSCGNLGIGQLLNFPTTQLLGKLLVRQVQKMHGMEVTAYHESESCAM